MAAIRELLSSLISPAELLQRAAKALGTIEKELSRLKHYEKELAAFDRKAFHKLHKEEQGRT